jgi:hypothetical protein
MYTATKLGDSANKELQRRIVTVQFDSGDGHVFVKDFSFRLTDTLEAIKKGVKSYLDEINTVPPVIDDLEPDAEVPPPAPTAEELARTEWDADVARLKKAQELLDMGVVLKPAFMTALDTLRTKIANDVKAEYLG